MAERPLQQGEGLSGDVGQLDDGIADRADSRLGQGPGGVDLGQPALGRCLDLGGPAAMRSADRPAEDGGGPAPLASSVRRGGALAVGVARGDGSALPLNTEGLWRPVCLLGDPSDRAVGECPPRRGTHPT